MHDIYQKLLNKKIDLCALGIDLMQDACPYFCTPKGAEIIGQAGVDGIHYVFIHGFADMVFAVSPMSTPGEYVHPVAGNFSDFLRLLLACGSADALEQAYGWEQEQFDAYVRDNQPTEEQKSVMQAIREEFFLTPMKEPFAHIKELQRGFDYSRIQFTEDYSASALQEPEPAEWSVSFTCGFETADECAPVCEEAAVGKEFAWDEEYWLIPAVYPCREGLVVDFCVRILPDRIQDFMRRWNLSCDSEYADFDLETQMQIDADNPLCVDFHAQICLDGRTVKASGSCGLTWNPCLPEQDRADVSQVQRVMEHYHLDPSFGWSVQRVLFPWAEKRKPKITSFTISLERYPVNFAGPHFRVHASGDTFRFLHPVTGVEHLLTVQEYEQQKMQETDFGSDRYEFPKHCIVMSYTLSPDLSGSFFVQDCAESEQPRKKEAEEETDQIRFGPVSVCAVGAFIGGACSSSTLVRNDVHAACSALHFVPEKDVTWRIVFSEKRKEDVTVSVELSSPLRSSSMGRLNRSGI